MNTLMDFLAAHTAIVACAGILALSIGVILAEARKCFKVNREAARRTHPELVAELVVILFPFSIYFIVAVFKNDLLHALMSPELSIASAVLSGAAVLRQSRLIAGVPRDLREDFVGRFTRSQALILLTLLCSVTVAALVAADSGPELLVVTVQSAIFGVALRLFVLKGLAGGVAQQLINSSERASAISQPPPPFKTFEPARHDRTHAPP